MWRASLRLQGCLFLCVRLLSCDTETIMAEEVFPAMRLPSCDTETIMAENRFLQCDYRPAIQGAVQDALPLKSEHSGT